MNERLPAFKASLQQLCEELLEEPSTHPSVDQWIAYSDGELHPEEEDRFQEHLLQCGDCVSVVKSIDSFSHGVAATEVEEVESVATWRLVREKVASTKADPTLEPFASISPKRRGASGTLRLVAASLMVATLGLTTWGTLQQRKIDTFTGPYPNPPVQVFYSDPERGTTGVEELRFPREAPLLLVRLVIPGGPPVYPEYRLEIVDSRHQRVWTGPIEPSQEQEFPLLLARDFLVDEGYRFRLFGADEEGEVRLEEFQVHVPRP